MKLGETKVDLNKIIGDEMLIEEEKTCRIIQSSEMARKNFNKYLLLIGLKKSS